nr:hypothetical protein Iba_chr13bCG3940 [Ipomoea batatas]
MASQSNLFPFRPRILQPAKIAYLLRRREAAVGERMVGLCCVGDDGERRIDLCCVVSSAAVLLQCCVVSSSSPLLLCCVAEGLRLWGIGVWGALEPGGENWTVVDY